MTSWIKSIHINLNSIFFSVFRSIIWSIKAWHVWLLVKHVSLKNKNSRLLCFKMLKCSISILKRRIFLLNKVLLKNVLSTFKNHTGKLKVVVYSVALLLKSWFVFSDHFKKQRLCNKQKLSHPYVYKTRSMQAFSATCVSNIRLLGRRSYIYSV